MADESKNKDSSSELGDLDGPQVVTPESGSPQSSSSSSDNPQPPKKSRGTSSFGKLGRLLHFSNKYFLIFILLLILAVGVVSAAYFVSKTPKQATSTGKSLTDQQLTQLKGNTTLVGDSEQILDIQSNSIFEGKVLVRDNLDVAGAVKIGGALTLPAVTVGGSSSLASVQINNTLSVSGTTTLQGPTNIRQNLNVAGSGSFGGSLSAGRLSVSNLQLAGDLILPKHINATGGVPGRSNGTALGNGGTASVSGTDTAGTISIHTGTSAPAGTFITVRFKNSFGSTPHVVVSPVGSSSAVLDYYISRNSTSFSLATASNPADSTTFTFDYIVID